MAHKKINKSAKIREAFETLGADTRPKDVIAALAKRKIKVSPAQVSNIKVTLEVGMSNGRNGSSDRFSLASLLVAKRFAEQMGSLEKAQGALAALAKLR